MHVSCSCMCVCTYICTCVPVCTYGTYTGNIKCIPTYLRTYVCTFVHSSRLTSSKTLAVSVDSPEVQELPQSPQCEVTPCPPTPPYQPSFDLSIEEADTVSGTVHMCVCSLGTVRWPFGFSSTYDGLSFILSLSLLTRYVG